MNDYPNIGKRFTYGGGTTLFGVPPEDRRQHTYVIGRTGLGKTTLLESLVIQDIEAGRGVAYLDPHGDSAEKLLNYIPPHRIKDTIYFNPADEERPIGLNLLNQSNSLDQHLVASTIVSTFQHMWKLRTETAPQLLYILSNAVQTILEAHPTESSLLSIQRLLVNEEYRRRTLQRVRNPVLLNFWIDEFDRRPLRDRTQAIAPIQNKLGRFLSSSLLRNILCQQKSTIDVASIMNDKKIFIANLSRGLIGADKSHILGSLLVTAFYLATMQRASLTEEERQDFYLYIDEFHNFGGDAFESILSEARKYRLSLILAHQYLGQLSESLQSAILGNVGTLMAFGVGPEDAIRLSRTLAPYPPDVLGSLARGEICSRTPNTGHPTEPFKAMVSPTSAPSYGRRTQIIRESRKLHGRFRERIERQMSFWLSH